MTIDMYTLAQTALNLVPVGTPKGRITALTLDPVVMGLVMAAFQMGQHDAEETVKPTSEALQEAFDEGYDEGKDEGGAQGYEEGLARGYDEGFREGQEALPKPIEGTTIQRIRELVNAENDALCAAEYKRGFEDGRGSK
jgi:hypothetical protein